MRNPEPGTNTEPDPPRMVVAALAGEAVAPRPGEVRVWVVSLDEPPVPPAELRGCLTADEHLRADRYKVGKARHQFVTGRGVLRRVLGACLGVNPGEVPITYTGAGKPVLGGANPGLHFNVTHTDALALIAVAGRPVGIDVERRRAVADPAGLVGRFFSPAERDAFAALPPDLRAAGFFRGWTCKEAVIKAAGLSVLTLDGFDVELHPDRSPAVLAARHAELVGRTWGLAAWEPVAGFAAAVAVEGVARLWVG